MMKPTLNRSWILLMVTLALPLALMILFVLSRLTGDADATLALLLLCTVSLYVSFAAGLLVPMWIGVVLLFSGSVERRRIVTLLLLSVLNIAVAITWIFFFVPQFGVRW
jgi:hypothetical protein